MAVRVFAGGLCFRVAAPRTCQADGLDVVLDGIGGVLPLRSFPNRHRHDELGALSRRVQPWARGQHPGTSRHRAWKQDLARGVRGITYVHFAATRLSTSSYEDIRRGMSRGANHRTREATRDTGCEQEAQVGRRKTPAITRSTGIRRRERRFESCRGHHLSPAVITLRTCTTCPIHPSRGLNRGTN